MMMQAGLPSSPTLSTCSQATLSSAPSASSSQITGFYALSFGYLIQRYKIFYNAFAFETTVQKLISEKEYDEAFYTSCNRVYRPGGIAETPAGVIATYD